MSDSVTPLDTLALVHGIEAAFTDAHGRVRETSAATKRALLQAMRVDAQTDADVRAALAAHEVDVWERALPPVVVARAERLDIPLVRAAQSQEVRWHLTLEDGAIRSGTVLFEELPLVESTGRNGRSLERRNLRIGGDVPAGYHVLRIDGTPGELPLIVTPGVCWLPPDVVAGERLAGIALQLYLLRSQTNWGIGDFGDLRRLAASVAASGADVIGLNPLHALFADDPEHASPYSPESRLLLNVLNIDVAAIPEFAASPRAQALVSRPAFVASLAACREAQLVDYSTVAQLKFDVLHLVYDDFVARAAAHRRAAFERFRQVVPAMLERTFLFAALRDFFASRDKSRAAWQQWPVEFRDPASPAVAQFAHEHARDVDFIAWLQWTADDQLAAAAEAARPMRVGLYRDLAVGADPGGAETWSNAHAVVDAARVGAPPDIYNPAGQNWDLPPFDPQALRAEGYASFIELVRANMRHAGGLRIDHVMALQHLYWIPLGATPANGAYVVYPLDELVGIIALESQRAQCLVVGEDLGTVPAGFRERMSAANILSYRVLFFERDGAADFNSPDAYPRAALAVLGSHDLPTLRAWWNGSDIRLRQRLGLFPDDDAAERQLHARAAEREGFVRALRRAGVLDDGQAVHGETLFTAAHAFLAQTAAVLALAQVDDITDETDPVNVPTTSDEHPNWRRRFALTLEQLAIAPRYAALVALLRAAGRLRDTAAGTPASAPKVRAQLS